jgi:RNA polymerase primary sigma factor
LVEPPSSKKTLKQLDAFFQKNLIIDVTQLSIEEATSNEVIKEQVKEVLNTLTAREQKVLILRFGLEDGKSRTLEEVGIIFKVTRERIRQIEAKAIRKLRHPSRSRKLKTLLNDPQAYIRKEKEEKLNNQENGNVEINKLLDEKSEGVENEE